MPLAGLDRYSSSASRTWFNKAVKAAVLWQLKQQFCFLEQQQQDVNAVESRDMYDHVIIVRAVIGPIFLFPFAPWSFITITDDSYGGIMITSNSLSKNLLAHSMYSLTKLPIFFLILHSLWWVYLRWFVPWRSCPIHLFQTSIRLIHRIQSQGTCTFCWWIPCVWYANTRIDINYV